MATSAYASTEETTNACRASRLLLGPCTDEMRDVLRHHVPPLTFRRVIAKKKSNLTRLTPPQKNLILPKHGCYTGIYDDMDIPLLYILLRNICNIPPHSKGWGNDPDPTDRSLSANIDRIRIARNHCVHSSSPALSNADFNTVWSTVRSAVVDLDSFLNNGNQYEREVDFLKHKTIDPVRDRHFLEEQRKLAEEEKGEQFQHPSGFWKDLGGRSRFAKLGMVTYDVLNQAYRDILELEVPHTDVENKVKSSPNKNKLKLNPDQEDLLKKAKHSGYKNFDISLTYTLIRNLCSTIPKPTKGNWGGNNMPSAGEMTVGDDIERIRLIRNSLSAHVGSASTPQTEFNDIWSMISDICQRLELLTGKKYLDKLNYIQKLTLKEEDEDAIIENIKMKCDREMWKSMMSDIKEIQSAVLEPETKVSEGIPHERFMEYMKKGKTTVRHARGIVVGCAGAGKTTLLYRLMGKSLDEIKEIQSTRGLHVYEHIFLVKKGSLFATENDALKKRLIRIPMSALESTEEKVEREIGNSDSLEVIQTDIEAGKELKAKQNTALSPKKSEAMDQQLAHDMIRETLYARERETNVRQLAQEVMREVLDAKENEISISMIDFAGQFAYYACHQIYMRSKAFYILVLDMTKAFQDVVDSKTDECQDAIFSKWSYKDYLHFWLDSIKSFGGTSAQVLAVATHTEGKKEKEKESFWESLWKLVPQEDKIWLQNCVGDKEFALALIEMNAERRLSLEYLENSIVEVVSQGLDTKIEVPSAWALLEHLLQKTEKPILSIDDINKVNEELPDEYQLRSQEEIFDFLSFFHEHGLLLFFREDGLRTHAILGIQWFSNAFSKLIADKNHISRDCKRIYIKEWNCFNETGNLKNSLVDALWKDVPLYVEYKTELMSYMERLRMLVSIDIKDNKISWYVPCMNKKSFTHGVFKQNEEKSSILCFQFTSFAMFVFYRLIAYCMSILRWTVQLDENKSPCLYHTAAIFETENHTVLVGIYDKDIQVQVLRINDLTPRVSCEIGKSIEIALTELTKTFDEKKTFQKGYKCLNIFCSKKDLTFIPENELSDIQCNCCIGEKHEIDVQWTLGFWKEGMQTSVLGERKGCSREYEIAKTKEVGTYPFAKRGPQTDAMTSHIKAEVTKSVGLIYIDGNPAGTGFRVGEKYIMTCLHVIKTIIKGFQDAITCERIYIQFERMRYFQSMDQTKIFRFEPTLGYKHEGFDVAVLELRKCELQFPPPLTLFSAMYFPSEECVHLVGHPGGTQMKEDSVCADFIERGKFDNRIKTLIKWSKEKFNFDYYSILLAKPRKILFDTTFDQGSSGSPGVLIKNHRPCVFLIVSGGVPSIHYEGKHNVEPENRLEFGYALKDIFDEMKASLNENKRKMSSEIFREWI